MRARLPIAPRDQPDELVERPAVGPRGVERHVSPSAAPASTQIRAVSPTETGCTS